MKRTAGRRSAMQMRFVCIAVFFVYAQWTSVHSAVFADAAAAGEDKVTLPSRNDATNPLKEPTPSTLQGTFLNGGNLTDANNGSASTTAAATTVPSTTAAIAETVWSVRTAAAATQPVQDRRRRPGHFSDAVAVAVRPDPIADDGKSAMANMLKNWFGDRKDERVVAAVEPSGATAAAAVSAGPFERWDQASEEQERALEDAMRAERPDPDSGAPPPSSSSSPPPPSSSVLAADQNTPSRWFVLLLSGNSTVAQMRRTDFAKYLKLNLAARLSLEYDEVKINRVLVVPPRLMVNVSVVPVSERSSAAATATVSATDALATATDSAAAAATVVASAADVTAASADVTTSAAAAAAATAASTPASRPPPSWPLSGLSPEVARIEDDDPLHNLVETNATLMELSGEEYRVERFMSLKSQKPQSMEETTAVVSDRHADIDRFIYATVGPLCFVVVLGFLSVTLYKYVRKHPVQWPWKRKFRQPSFWPVGSGGSGDGGSGGGGGGGRCLHRHRRMTDEYSAGGGASFVDLDDDLDDDNNDPRGYGGGSVNVIYSGEFEQSQQQQLSGSWLDDASFAPDDGLDRIRTPTLLRTTAAPAVTVPPQQPLPLPPPPPPAVTNDERRQLPRRHRHRHRLPSSSSSASAAAAAAEAVTSATADAIAVHHSQSPRLSRDNKLRILGCKQSCLLLPAVRPVPSTAFAAAPAFAATAATTPIDDDDDGGDECNGTV